MGYDRGDGIPFDFEPNGISFGSKSKGILSARSYSIQFERKQNTSFLSVQQPLHSWAIATFPRQKYGHFQRYILLFGKAIYLFAKIPLQIVNLRGYRGVI